MRAALAVAVPLIAALAAPVVHVLPLHKQIDVPCHNLSLKHRYGNVDIVGVDNPARVTVDAIVRVAAGTEQVARAFAEGVDVDVKAAGGSVSLTTTYPRQPVADSQLSYEVNIDVSVPAGAHVDLDNSFGDVHVTGVTGGCRLADRFGEIELDRCGQCEVSGRYGDVRSIEAEGPLVVENAFGDVVLREAGSRVQVDNRYGTVQVDRVRGETHIENLLGNVVARRGEGRLFIVNDFGDVSALVDDPDLSALDILSRLGRVELSLARGVPFQLGGRTRQGTIMPVLPVSVSGIGIGESVSGSAGSGGPDIQLEGVWSDFVIRGVAEPDTGGAAPVRR